MARVLVGYDSVRNVYILRSEDAEGRAQDRDIDESELDERIRGMKNVSRIYDSGADMNGSLYW